ncbi:aspartyl-phosphate phosphatase Spo0E family protein [Alicyclobacillus dauci]|uniref:Aspartyl-phosphate phosphatase Spo0E family protein n=1 Tax=Alicyclobacillus dauci TaxID=1475485 RepID=A0ABY6Z742_9BACL|nr:aspartyl-phosphate phosphatase Spo0E family protein [Alicyclobacillus dauci]WAH38701.1 aspartyl-phosphate phosphatase Spo0E family protein [Alicyclobacillus dauci]
MTIAENTISVIEYLREKMILTANQTGDLLHEDVIRVSQQLDLYLVQSQLQRASAGEQTFSEGNEWPLLPSGSEIFFSVPWQPGKVKRHLKVVGCAP